jgi:hypothetical protein
MKHAYLSLLLILVIAGSAFGQVATDFPSTATFYPDTSRKSLKAYKAALWGKDSLVIHWYSPAVRGRVIWGELVPYDKVWVTGAHMTTNIEFRANVDLGGVRVKKGRYALFTIPGKDSWTLILNKKWQGHLAESYDPIEDVVRIPVQPKWYMSSRERLEWGFVPESDKQGTLFMRWENLGITVPVYGK